MSSFVFAQDIKLSTTSYDNENSMMYYEIANIGNSNIENVEIILDGDIITKIQMIRSKKVFTSSVGLLPGIYDFKIRYGGEEYIQTIPLSMNQRQLQDDIRKRKIEEARLLQEQETKQLEKVEKEVERLEKIEEEKKENEISNVLKNKENKEKKESKSKVLLIVVLILLFIILIYRIAKKRKNNLITILFVLFFISSLTSASAMYCEYKCWTGGICQYPLSGYNTGKWYEGCYSAGKNIGNFIVPEVEGGSVIGPGQYFMYNDGSIDITGTHICSCDENIDPNQRNCHYTKDNNSEPDLCREYNVYDWYDDRIDLTDSMNWVGTYEYEGDYVIQEEQADYIGFGVDDPLEDLKLRALDPKYNVLSNYYFCNNSKTQNHGPLYSYCTDGKGDFQDVHNGIPAILSLSSAGCIGTCHDTLKMQDGSSQKFIYPSGVCTQNDNICDVTQIDLDTVNAAPGPIGAINVKDRDEKEEYCLKDDGFCSPYIWALTGEQSKDHGDYVAGDLVQSCCGDDSNETYIDSRNRNIGPGGSPFSPSVACCSCNSKCVDYQGRCRIPEGERGGKDSDNNDNDCDGLIDEEDPDTYTTIKGRVVLGGNPVSGVKIISYNPTNKMYPVDLLDINNSASYPINIDENGNTYVFTDAAGQYEIKVISGYHGITAEDSNTGYFSEIKYMDYPRSGNVSIDFHLSNLVCNSDCTDSSGVCNPACSSTCGATGFNLDRLNKCAGKPSNTKIFDRIEGDNLYYIECCQTELPPVINQEEELNATVDNLIKYTRIVEYQEKPVKMVVAVWE
jgi:hypothetical protein